MKIIGLISGTSHDGIDAIAVDFEYDGEVLSAQVLGSSQREYPVELRQRLIAALPPNQTTFAEVCQLDTMIAKQFALASKQLNLDGVELISSHGQTVYHWVENNVALGTTQLGQPAWIASLTGVPVLADLRINDIALGGQGAPVVPVLDLLALAEKDTVVASVNLGGIANITIVDSHSIRAAYDTGPASALIDAVVLKHQLHPAGFDEDGLIAASGRVNQQLLTLLLQEEFYSLQEPKSTGKELFHIYYLESMVSKLDKEISVEDLVATVTELTAETLAEQINKHSVDKIVFAGGGVHNKTLMSSIEKKTKLKSESFAEFGISQDLKEAFAMALIGWLSAHDLPSTFPESTGAKSPAVLGTFTPGKNGFPNFERFSEMPSRLVINNG